MAAVANGCAVPLLQGVDHRQVQVRLGRRIRRNCVKQHERRASCLEHIDDLVDGVKGRHAGRNQRYAALTCYCIDECPGGEQGRGDFMEGRIELLNELKAGDIPS